MLLLGIFISLAIENIGVPWPTEASYLLAAVLLKKGFPMVQMLILLTAAHVVGSVIAFGIGWWGEGWLSRHLQNRPRFIKASKVIHQWYSAHGQLTIFATRFIGYVRPWSSLAAGFAQIDFKVFLFWTFAGSLLFNLMVTALAFRFYYWWEQYGLWFKIGSAVLFVLSFSVIFLIRYFHQRHSKVPEVKH